MFKKIITIIIMLALTACAGMQKSCSSSIAEEFGGDWIVVQYKTDGSPMSCWKLNDTSISNEPNSDGIFWQDSKTTHLVHISGWYNRVQVKNGDWESATSLLGLNSKSCKSGKYEEVKSECKDK